MNGPGAVIEADAVAKTYPGGVRALRGVSFRIQRGERACLLGPNGAGKTTLIRILIGAFRPTSGTARVFGHPSGGPTFNAAKRRLGVVPQSPGMYRDLTCREYLDLVRSLYGRGDPEATVASFRLGSFADRPLATLSGGQQRRVSLAAAVLPEPELLLLDEPTAGLDPVATREVHAQLRELMQGRTVVLCTHNLLEAEALCESAIILRSGEALVHESIAALRRRAHAAVAFASEDPAALRAALEGMGQTVEEDGEELRVPSDDPKRDAAALLAALVGQGVPVYGCRVAEPSLEELFLGLVGGPDADA